MKLTKALLGIAALLLVGSMDAATVSFTDTQLINNGGMDFYLGKFDSNLGSLTGVRLTIFSETVASPTANSFIITNNAGSNGRARDFNDKLSVAAYQGGLSPFTSNATTLTTNPSTVSPGYTILPHTSRTFTVGSNQTVYNSFADIASGSFGDYTIAGGNGTVGFWVADAPNITMTGGNYTANTDGYSPNTTLTLTYTYDVNPGPVPVPEASTVIVQLLIVGAGVGLFVIRRRQRALAAVKA